MRQTENGFSPHDTTQGLRQRTPERLERAVHCRFIPGSGIAISSHLPDSSPEQLKKYFHINPLQDSKHPLPLAEGHSPLRQVKGLGADNLHT